MEFHKDGTLPQNGEVFVFGSNLAGRHGGGAALVAKQKFGALQGFGSGPMGNCYAIPTKDATVANSLPLELIKGCVQKFLAYANLYPNTEFFVTRIGCVLAGYSDAEIAPMFAGATSNCSFAQQWLPYLNGEGGKATAGKGGEIRIRYYDSKAQRYRTAVGYVGEDEIEANVAYKLDADHKFIKV